MAKFINVHELRSDEGIATLMRRQPRQLRQIGGNFDEPFSEDGEDDGIIADAATPDEPEAPVPSREDITWIRSRLATDSIRSTRELASGGLAKTAIILKNEKTLKVRETWDELNVLMDAP